MMMFKEVATSFKTMADKMPNFSKNMGGDLSKGNTDLKQPAFEKSVKAEGVGGHSVREINNNPDLLDNEKKKIEEISPYSDKVNDFIRSTDELKIYENANLKETTIGEKDALIRDDIDFDQIDDDGFSNLDRMSKGRPPLDVDGRPIELHHVGQKPDSPLAELRIEEHRGKENNTVLHDNSNDSLIDRTEFQKEKKEYWQARAEQINKDA
jgi:hypothetical protein